MPGDGEEEKGPCRETGDRCARDIEREAIGRELSVDALDTLTLFRAAGDQRYPGFDGPGPLNILAVCKVAEILDVPFTRNVFELLRVCTTEVSAIVAEERASREEESGVSADRG